MFSAVVVKGQDHRITIQFGGKLILVPGTANGKNGFFILDTGAARFTLNSRHFRQTSGDEVYRANIQIGDMRWNYKAALLWDLSYLEQSKGKTILGLLNTKILSDHQIVLNVSDGQMQLLSLQDDDWTAISLIPPDFTMSFKKKGGMPGLEVEIGENTYLLGLDTGAECNLLNTKLKVAVNPNLRRQREMAYRRSNKKIVRTIGGELEQMRVGVLACGPMVSLFGSMKEINARFPGARLDGLLGYEFLRQFTVAINFRTKQIAFWSNDQQVIVVRRDSSR